MSSNDIIVTVRRNIDDMIVMTKKFDDRVLAELYLASWTRTPGYYGDIS